MIKSIIFLKLLFLNFFLDFNPSLANENIDHDFSYIEDEDDRKRCLKLFKNGDLKFDQRSKLYFQLRSNLMGGVINSLYVMIRKLPKHQVLHLLKQWVLDL